MSFQCRFRPRARLLMSAGVFGLLSVGAVSPVWAGQDEPTANFDIPEQPLSASLKQYGVATGQQVIFSVDLVRNKRAREVTGNVQPSKALDTLLLETGLAALPGAEICREDLDVFIDKKHVATALMSDEQGRKMPSWSGCVVVQDDEVFLLNAHPRSLDGRYFGVTKAQEVDGVAVLVFSWPG